MNMIGFKIGDWVLPHNSGEIAVVVRAPKDMPIGVRWADGKDGFYPPERLTMVMEFPAAPRVAEQGERATDLKW